MERIEQVFAIVALLQGGVELPLATGLTFDQCSDRVEIYMQAANNIQDTNVAIICTMTGGRFVSF